MNDQKHINATILRLRCTAPDCLCEQTNISQIDTFHVAFKCIKCGGGNWEMVTCYKWGPEARIIPNNKPSSK